MTTKRSWSWALLGGLTVLAALQGCGDDDNGNDKPPTTVNPKGGSSGTGNEAGSDNGGSPDTGGTRNNGGSGGTGNTGNTAGTGDEPVAGNGTGGAPPEPACDLPELGEDGCFNCPVKGEQEQWLNRCLDTDCVPFNNERVTQIKEDGTLPPLPN